MIRLKELRQRKRVEKKALSDAIGISFSALTMYENGSRSPSQKTQEKLARYFDVDIDYLMGRSDIPRKDDYLSFVENSDFSYDETVMIKKFRKANKKTKAAILILLDLYKGEIDI